MDLGLNMSMLDLGLNMSMLDLGLNMSMLDLGLNMSMLDLWPQHVYVGPGESKCGYMSSFISLPLLHSSFYYLVKEGWYHLVHAK